MDQLYGIDTVTTTHPNDNGKKKKKGLHALKIPLRSWHLSDFSVKPLKVLLWLLFSLHCILLEVLAKAAAVLLAWHSNLKYTVWCLALEPFNLKVMSFSVEVPNRHANHPKAPLFKNNKTQIHQVAQIKITSGFCCHQSNQVVKKDCEVNMTQSHNMYTSKPGKLNNVQMSMAKY